MAAVLQANPTFLKVQTALAKSRSSRLTCFVSKRASPKLPTPRILPPNLLGSPLARFDNYRHFPPLGR
jgi:hypothetical protein